MHWHGVACPGPANEENAPSAASSQTNAAFPAERELDDARGTDQTVKNPSKGARAAVADRAHAAIGQDLPERDPPFHHSTVLRGTPGAKASADRLIAKLKRRVERLQEANLVLVEQFALRRRASAAPAPSLEAAICTHRALRVVPLQAFRCA